METFKEELEFKLETINEALKDNDDLESILELKEEKEILEEMIEQRNR